MDPTKSSPLGSFAPIEMSVPLTMDPMTTLFVFALASTVTPMVEEVFVHVMVWNCPSLSTCFEVIAAFPESPVKKHFAFPVDMISIRYCMPFTPAGFFLTMS